MSQIKDTVASCQPTSSEKAGAGAGLSLDYFLPGSRGDGEQKLLAALPGGTLLLLEHLKPQQQAGTALGLAVWETGSSQGINWETENLSGRVSVQQVQSFFPAPSLSIFTLLVKLLLKSPCISLYGN